MELTFTNRVIEWRGPAPCYFVPLPEEESAEIHEVASSASYGWGVIPVEARLGEVTFTTSLFPKEGAYLLPLKAAVRKPQDLAEGDEVTLELRVRL
ncbi:DUF1905 domain-containing protein [Streptomyces glomeratus]|uniref:DUF1905 domain-containing protein n=1 Tax=Streptomyces glomeratus TaxID=284452 RepID=A0ABP6LS62_9ACTN|nr:DUF1905 domain-containing protein [Streptomyces glomeratus]MCF1512619.1 DUF1905 domain-containing protein [Streptomyces glomeratus]